MSVDPRRRTRKASAAAATVVDANSEQTTAAAPSPPPPAQPKVESIKEEQEQTVNDNEQKSFTPPGSPPPDPLKLNEGKDGFKLKFCTVCASNNNRSMESHLQLSKHGFPCLSFGTGSKVRLPGPSITQPNVFDFNVTSYDKIYNQLMSQDQRLYKANGLLSMLDRNRHVKWGPEQWHDWPVGTPRVSDQQRHNKGSAGTEAGVVDIIITCEERCWDSVVEDLASKGSPLNRPVHVFNVDIKDNHEDSLVGGQAILDLATELNKAAIEERDAIGADGFDSGNSENRQGFDERVPEILAAWQDRWPFLPALWTLAWF